MSTIESLGSDNDESIADYSLSPDEIKIEERKDYINRLQPETIRAFCHLLDEAGYNFPITSYPKPANPERYLSIEDMINRRNGLYIDREISKKIEGQYSLRDDGTSFDFEQARGPAVGASNSAHRVFFGHVDCYVTDVYDEEYVAFTDTVAVKPYRAKAYERRLAPNNEKYDPVYELLMEHDAEGTGVENQFKKQAEKDYAFQKFAIENGFGVYNPIALMHTDEKSYVITEYNPNTSSLDNEHWSKIGWVLAVNPSQRSDLLTNTAEELARMHSMGVFHLDLQLKNVVVFETGEYRLIDWESAKYFKDPEAEQVIDYACNDLDVLFGSLLKYKFFESHDYSRWFPTYKKQLMDPYFEGLARRTDVDMDYVKAELESHVQEHVDLSIEEWKRQKRRDN